MITNHISCMVGVVATYILSYHKIDKTRAVILFLLSLVSILINALAYGYLVIEIPPTVTKWHEIVWSLVITGVGFLIIFLFSRFALKPFGRSKLNKKIVAFTKKANPNLDLEIMAGDLTFFGMIDSMESNSQVRQLIDNRFRKIKIIAKSPVSTEDKLRIGKLFHMLNGQSLQIKFFTQNLCDLSLRFRNISSGDGSTATVNIFKLAAETAYFTEELSSTSSDQKQRKRHETFKNLWNTYWNTLPLDQNKIQECIDTYNHFTTQSEDQS